MIFVGIDMQPGDMILAAMNNYRIPVYAERMPRENEDLSMFFFSIVRAV